MVWVGVPPSTSRHKGGLKTVFLYEQFLREFNTEERKFFSSLVKECVSERNYPKGEDLFQYCYFSTLKHRLEDLWRRHRSSSGLGAYIYSQSLKEVEYSLGYYREVLEKGAISHNGGPSPSSWLEMRLKEVGRLQRPMVLPYKTPETYSVSPSLDKGLQEENTNPS